MTTRLGQIAIGLARYLGFAPKSTELPPAPNPARTIVVPGRVRHFVSQRNFNIAAPGRVRHFVTRGDMIYDAQSKRPDESPVYSLDIRRELASGETISSVTTAIEVAEGSDPDAADMLQGSAGYSGTTVSQRVRNGVDGVTYHLKFEVATSRQVLTLVVRLDVEDDGAFVL